MTSRRLSPLVGLFLAACATAVLAIGVISGGGDLLGAGMASPDAGLPDRQRSCIGWPGKSTPAGVVWWVTPVEFDDSDSTDLRGLRLTAASADAGDQADLLVAEVGINPDDGGAPTFADVKRVLDNVGLSVAEDPGRDRCKVGAAGCYLAAPLRTDCRIRVWREGAADAPSRCACGPGCWQRRGDAGVYAPACKGSEFGEGSWSWHAPDAGMGAASKCIPVLCRRPFGASALPKVCR